MANRRTHDGACSAALLPPPRRGHGIRAGTAVSDAALTSDVQYRTVLRREYSIVTAENAMKWGRSTPTATASCCATLSRLVGN